MGAKDDVDLPTDITVERLAEARIKEIKDLTLKIEQPRQGQLTSQQVPRHMRRRAVSHNPNRLPTRLRAKHLHERAKSGGDASKPPKRPSRKHRRRSRCLLIEYNRRQVGKPRWLESHIWHAKRFHMTIKWGMKLPHFPNDKCFRPCYRASVKKTLMFDLSYYHLFELEAKTESELISTLKTVVKTDNVIITSEKETIWQIYYPGKYPYGYIGEVSCLRIENREENRCRLWIWSHPSFAHEVRELFLSVFRMTEIASGICGPSMEESANSSSSRKKIKLDVNITKLSPRNVPFDRNPKYESSDGIRLIDLSFTLNRFRLIGPHTERILRKTLRISSIEEPEIESTSSSSLYWWNTFFREMHNSEDFNIQSQIWKDAEMEIGSVMCLTVRDPRVILPPKRAVIADSEENIVAKKVPASMTNSVRNSPLWFSNVRDNVSLSKCPDTDVNKRRSENLVPGSDLPIIESESRVPVILLGNENGWDVISVAGWGMPLWMNFIMYGARVGGLRELQNHDLECGRISIPIKDPDSKAGSVEAETVAVSLRENYFKYPPDKRCNFNKLGFNSPFLLQWKVLINDWLKLDKPLVPSLDKRKKTPNNEMIQDFYVLRNEEMKIESLEDRKCLVPIRIDVIGKGTVSNQAAIFVPSKSDLEMYADSNSGDWHFICEPVQNDRELEILRKSAKEEHSAKKINLRRKWKKIKVKLTSLRRENASSSEVEALQSNLNDLRRQRETENREYEKKSRDLWLSDDRSSIIRESCTRPIAGFVVKGGFSLKLGNCVGVGFVAAPAFTSLNEERIVLVRNCDSFQYRFAKLSILHN